MTVIAYLLRIDYKKKAQKNFIKENIQKVKGCNGCLLEKKMLKMSIQEKAKVKT